MKKALSVVLSVVMVFALLPVLLPTDVSAATTSNDFYGYEGIVVSTRGHFENANANTLSSGGWSNTAATPATGDAHSGNGYVQIAPGGQIGYTATNMLPGRYVLRGYYKHLDDAATGYSQMFMSYPGVTTNYNDVFKYSKTWKRFGMMVNAAAITSTGTIKTWINTGEGTATLCLDDVELIRLDNYDAKNLVQNSGFDISPVGTKSPDMFASWFNLNEGNCEIVNDAYTGDTALKITNGRVYSWLNLPVASSEGTRYDFSARVKWAAAKNYLKGMPGNYTPPSLLIESYTGSKLAVSKSYTVSKENGLASADWNRISFLLDEELTPAGMNTMRLFLKGGSGVNGCIWDDICIKAVDDEIDFMDESGTKPVEFIENTENTTCTARANYMAGADGKLFLAAYKYDSYGELRMINAGYAKLDKSGTSSICKLSDVSADNDNEVFIKAYLWDNAGAPVAVKELRQGSSDYGAVFEDGFEATTGWRPDNVNMEWVNAFMETENVHSGSKALKLSGYNARAHFIYDGLLPGNEYTFSYWYKGSVDSGDGLTIRRYDWANDADDLAYTKSYESGGVFSEDEWTQISYTFTHYEGSQIIISPWIRYGSGTVYVDDMKLERTKRSNIVRISTDQVFYYTDLVGNGTATITLDPCLTDKGYTVDVSLEKDGDVLYKQTDLAFEDNIITFDYDLALMTQKTEEYRVVARVKGERNITLDTEYQEVYRFDRPTTVSKDGTFTDIKGKRIDPTFMYHIGYNDFELAASAGINVVQWSPAGDMLESLSQLDEMYEMGVYAAVVCYWGMSPAGSVSNYDKVREFVMQIKNHPAVFCYMIMDEPFLNNSNAYDDLRNSYIMLRTADPARPTYICEGFAPYMKEVAKYCDLLAPDIYPGYSHDSFATCVGRMMKLGHEYVNYDKPMLTILQAFTQNGNKPTATELHSMMYQSLLAGGNAVGFYTWEPDNPNVDKKICDDFYWPMMQTFYKKEKTVVYDYYAHGKGTQLNKNIDNNADVWYESWYNEGKDAIYMVVQNRLEDEELSVAVPLVAEDGKALVTEFEASTPGYGGEGVITGTTGSNINVKLAPCQAVLIKVVLK